MSILDDIETRSEVSLHNILVNLLDKNNIEMKTEISNPSAISVLVIIAIHYKKRGLEVPYVILKSWIKRYLEFMVSHDRLSRKEVIQALQLFNEQNRDIRTTTKDRLMGKIE